MGWTSKKIIFHCHHSLSILVYSSLTNSLYKRFKYFVLLFTFPLQFLYLFNLLKIHTDYEVTHTHTSAQKCLQKRVWLISSEPRKFQWGPETNKSNRLMRLLRNSFCSLSFFSSSVTKLNAFRLTDVQIIFQNFSSVLKTVRIQSINDFQKRCKTKFHSVLITQIKPIILITFIPLKCNF